MIRRRLAALLHRWADAIEPADADSYPAFLDQLRDEQQRNANLDAAFRRVEGQTDYLRGTAWTPVDLAELATRHPSPVSRALAAAIAAEQRQKVTPFMRKAARLKTLR